MVDESMDKAQLALPPQPWEFRAKKAWQRLFIMLGGIIVNVLVAIVIYTGIMAYWGESYMPVSSLKYGITVDSVGKQLGLENGDKILKIDNKPTDKFKDITRDIIFNSAKTIQVERDGKVIEIPIPSSIVGQVLKTKNIDFIEPRVPFVVLDVMNGSLAQKMGLQKGDSLIAFNGKPIMFRDQFIDEAHNTPAQDSFNITVMNSEGSIRTLSGIMSDNKKVGVSNKMDFDFFESKTINYNLFTALGRGVVFTGEQFAFYVAQFKLLFTSKDVKLSENLGGIGSFAKIFPGTFDWHAFWMLTAFISIILAFMNLLPIPGLDGGYVMFLLWEMITGRKVNDKVMEVATTVGLVLLLALMLYANGLDIFRAFSK